MFNGLEHTAIASPNPEKLAQWYQDTLEFRINFSYGGNFFVRAKNGAMLEIIPSEGARAPQKMKDEGLRHLAIEVDDFDAAYAHLKSQGVHFYTEPFLMGEYRLAFFADADGNYIHLIKRPEPLP
jgi:glyoxylase I family protein